MENKHIIRCPHHMSWEKCKFKQHNPITHLFEWPKSGMLMPNVDQDMEQQKLAVIAAGNVQSYNHFNKQFWNSHKIKNSYHSILILNIWYLPKRDENLCSHKRLRLDVYSSFIYNCENLKPIKMFFSMWMDE